MISKIEYTIEQDKWGRTQIKKMGLAPVQRSGIEYEFSWVIDMDVDHNAMLRKSRAEPLADLTENKLGLVFFQLFYEWMLIGEDSQKTKQELIEFSAFIGLEPNDIEEALAAASIQFDSNPDIGRN